MARYFAQIEGGIVQRVVVAPSLNWCASRLGGDWVEAADPYAPAQTLNYCGPGYGYDPSFPERFGAPWAQPVPDPETGVWSSYAKGDVRWHNGQLWKSTVDGNVWEPGVSAWHPKPEIDGVRPAWIQPTGSHDVWPLGAEVKYDNRYWRSERANNVWEPSTVDSGWIEIDVEGNLV